MDERCDKASVVLEENKDYFDVQYFVHKSTESS